MPTKRTQRNRLYNEKNYARIYITVPKVSKPAIEAHAASKGKSVNKLFNDLIWADMGITEDEWKEVKHIEKS